MRQLLYKKLFVLVFITTAAFAQTKEVILKKSFIANENTILNLDLDNVAILFEESFDGKIHFDYSMTFGRYSKRKREIIKNQAKVKVTKNKDLITLEVKNSMFLGVHHITYISMDSLIASAKGYMKTEITKKYQHKTKDSLINEIKYSEGNNLQSFLKKNEMRYQDVPSFKNKKLIKKVFIIKVPSNVKIRLKGVKSNVRFTYNMTTSFKGNIDGGKLKLRKLNADKTTISMSNGILEIEEINGGNYTFRDLSKCLLGTVKNTKIHAEGSQIEIGEIQENVFVNDFNSEFFFYNFSNNFKEFKIEGDYSKLHFFDSKNEVSLSAFGNTTTININDIKSSFEPRKGGGKFKMLEKKLKDTATASGHIEIDITHGIINIISEKKE